MQEAPEPQITSVKESLKHHPELQDLLCVLREFEGIVKGGENGNEWVAFVAPERSKSCVFTKTPTGYSMEVVSEVASDS